MAIDPKTAQVDVTEKTKHVGDPSAIRLGACRLVLTIGSEPGRTMEIVKPELLVGAADDCDFKVDVPGVSRQHFRIVREGATFRAVDLNSTNGTFVAGVRVKEVFLRPGAIIRAGDAHLRFEPVFAEERMHPSDRAEFGHVLGQSYRMREIFGVLETVAPARRRWPAPFTTPARAKAARSPSSTAAPSRRRSSRASSSATSAAPSPAP